MSWLSNLFKAPPPPGAFVCGLLHSMMTTPSAWERAKYGFRHIASGMTVEVIEEEDYDEVYRVLRLNPPQELTHYEGDLVKNAYFELAAGFEAREVEAANQRAAQVRAHFENSSLTSSPST